MLVKCNYGVATHRKNYSGVQRGCISKEGRCSADGTTSFEDHGPVGASDHYGCRFVIGAVYDNCLRFDDLFSLGFVLDVFRCYELET